MKLKALSHYDNDINTRFGDCILMYDNSNLIVYDCGHSKHKEAVVDFLERNTAITSVSIVVSHNDSDHTDGILPLLDYLYENRRKYTVRVYSSLYLKDVDAILEILDDKRRTREATKQHILETFDKIKEIVEKTQEYNFTVVNAEVNTSVAAVTATIVGPTVDEFAAVVAQAIEDDTVTQIEGETVMNAASVQMQCDLDSNTTVLLCGDASPNFLHDLDYYGIIQLPHHGKLADAEVVFDALSNAGSKLFLVSDNTGSGATSGGSDDLIKSDARKGKIIKNTKSGIVELPEASIYDGGGSKTRSGIVVPSSQKTGGYGA
jgi:hypothetical protein